MIRRHSTTMALLVGLLLVGSPTAWAADYYTAPTGNDSNDGSQSAPWSTVGRVQGLQSGDVLHVAPGTYAEGAIHVPSGVTLKGEGSPRPILRPGGGITSSNCSTGRTGQPLTAWSWMGATGKGNT